LPAASYLQYAYLSYFSSPSSERPLYRAMSRLQPASIVEMGVAMGRRTTRLIETALRFRESDSGHFTGIDLFEARPSHSPGMTLKRAHRTLGSLEAEIRLVPGDPLSALARTANSLTETDLIVIAADQDPDSLAEAWLYVPRMIHAESMVFLEESTRGSVRTSFRQLTPIEINNLAIAAGRQIRRAA